MTKPNNYIAVVKISENDKKEIKKLLENTNKTHITLYDAYVNLMDGIICKNDIFDSYTIRTILHEATVAQSKTLRSILMCIAKGFYWCSEEELKEANIIF